MSIILFVKAWWNRSPPGPPSHLLMETGDFLLLESGDKIIL